MAALTAREYGWSFAEFLAAEPSLTNAYYAAACEHAGMTGDSFVDVEIRRNLKDIMDGAIEY